MTAGALTDAFGVRVVILGGGVLLLGCGALSFVLIGEPVGGRGGNTVDMAGP